MEDFAILSPQRPLLFMNPTSERALRNAYCKNLGLQTFLHSQKANFKIASSFFQKPRSEAIAYQSFEMSCDGFNWHLPERLPHFSFQRLAQMAP